MTDQEWWRGAVIYQIYPRSYMDANGDGVGDLKGITEKLPYIADLGVDGIWLSPFFKSPMKDFGYDVSDFCDVDPLFGTLDDFKELLSKAHELGLKVIIDYILTHTSDQHAWFAESRMDQTNDKADWYIWADPKPDGSPPNNWQAHFGGSSWTFDIRRGQYYMHNFLSEQPDVNLRSKGARNAIFDCARFWLDMGVDGFRLDAARHYFCDPELKDNPVNPTPRSIWFDHPAPFSMQTHENDIHIPDTVTFMKEFRALLDGYDAKMAVAEIGGENGSQLAAEYTSSPDRIHTAYNFSLITGNELSARKIRRELETFLNEPGDGWPSWAFSNHDVIRVASRWHPDKKGWPHEPALSKMLMALLTSLYGTVFTYQGEELGLPEAEIPYERLQDPFGLYLYPKWQGRDGCRTPMPWNETQPHAGFSKAGDTWLPVPDSHFTLSVSEQQDQPSSTLSFTRLFLQWRRSQAALRFGDIKFVDVDENDSDELLVFVREYEGTQVYCVFNMSADAIAYSGLPSELHGKESAFGGFDHIGSWGDGSLNLPPYGLYYGIIDRS